VTYIVGIRIDPGITEMLRPERQDGVPLSASGMSTFHAHGSPNQPIPQSIDDAGHNGPPFGGKCCKCHIIPLGCLGTGAICPSDGEMTSRFACCLPTNTMAASITAGKRIAPAYWGLTEDNFSARPLGNPLMARFELKSEVV